MNDHAAILNILNLLHAGRIEEGLAAIDDAEGLTVAMRHQLRGRACLRQHDWLSAHDHLEMAIGADPHSADALLCLGMASYELGLFEKAVDCYRRCIVIQPNGGVQWMKLGAAHGMLQHHAEAIACLERAVLLSPNDADCLHSAGVVFGSFGNDELALDYVRKAQAVDPKHVNAEVAEAATLLRMGQWTEGWKKFEARWRLRTVAAPWWYQGAPLYEGDLEGLRGKRVLLRAEQGFGDSIQFARYVEPLSHVASHLILEVQPGLETLFSALPAEVVVCKRTERLLQVLPLPDSELPEYDVQTSLMSLPLLFGTTPETVPPPADFGIEPLRDGQGIGVCWAGGPRRDEPLANAVDQRRSLSDAWGAELLWAAEQGGGTRVLSLQREHLPTEWSWRETAEAISSLRLVITVDTAIAHLAASLGVETWMLNRFDSCWRWGMKGERTPWYPTMKIIRQTYLGDWQSVIDRVKADLETWEPAE